jgi:hypothetical protein
MRKPEMKIKLSYKHDRYGNLKYDKYGNPIPIYLKVKKLKVCYIDKKQKVSFHNVKPYFKNGFWCYDVKGMTCIIPNPDTMVFHQENKWNGIRPIVITRWSDWDELIRQTENDWLKP